MDLAERSAVEVAVVELDPSFVDDRLDTECRRSLLRAQERTRDDTVDMSDRSGECDCLHPPEFIERRIDATEEQPRGVVGRAAVTDDEEHERFLTGGWGLDDP